MASTPRILLLDDDTALLDFLRFVISTYFPSARVTTLTNGYDLLYAYQQHGADLLIMDHRLPDVIGSALLQYMRDTGMTLPIILISGLLSRDEAPTDARTYFLPKPIQLTDFVGTLTHALSITHDRTLIA